MIVITHRKFDKKYVKLPRKLREKAKERMQLFSTDSFNPILDNHQLQGKWFGHRSINVTGDFRAVFKQMEDTAIFVDIDTHHNLYGS